MFVKMGKVSVLFYNCWCLQVSFSLPVSLIVWVVHRSVVIWVCSSWLLICMHSSLLWREKNLSFNKHSAVSHSDWCFWLSSKCPRDLRPPTQTVYNIITCKCIKVSSHFYNRDTDTFMLLSMFTSLVSHHSTLHHI